MAKRAMPNDVHMRGEMLQKLGIQLMPENLMQEMLTTENILVTLHHMLKTMYNAKQIHRKRTR